MNFSANWLNGAKTQLNEIKLQPILKTTTSTIHTKLNLIKLKPALGAVHAIQPENGSGLF